MLIIANLAVAMPAVAGISRSLQRRIMLSVALGLLALVAVLGVGAIQILQTSTRRVLDEHLRVAVHIADHLDSTLTKDITRLLRIGDVAMAAGAGRPALLQGLADQLALFRWVVVAEGGRIIWSRAPVGVQDVLVKGLRSSPIPAPPRLSGLRWVGDVPLVMYVGRLETAASGTDAAIAAAIDLRGSQLAGAVGTLEPVTTGHVVVVDRDGWVLVGPPQLLFTRREHPEFLASLIRTGRPRVARTVEGETTAIPHVMAFAPLSAAPWGVAYGQAEPVVMEPIVRLRRLLLAVGSLAVLVALLYAWRDTRAVVAPLKDLTVAAARIADGDLRTPITTHRSDEVGALARSLEQMRVRLNDSLETMRRREREVAVLQERERIAREMHDGLAQALGYLYASARALQAEGASRPAHVLEEMAETAGRAYDEVRQAIFELRTMVARGPDLIPALTEYLHDFSERAGLPVDLNVVGDVTNPTPQAEVQIIRIVQESLTNVRKHAQARRVRVSVAQEGGALLVQIADDGRGFDPEQVSGGFGLQSMRERAAGIGGHVTIDSLPGRGTRIRIRVPVQTHEKGGRGRDEAHPAVAGR